ncbi:MAG: (2Fe-2S) ferredoxin domain-containing protein [Cyanobacteria bacterium J06648_11]
MVESSSEQSNPDTEGTAAIAPQPEVAKVPPYGWHLFLCADQTKPKCCPKPDGLETWDYLKKRLKTLDLESGDRRVLRTKANCLRMCDLKIPGPILLVYPGGYWYRSVTPDVIERVLQDHVIGGQPVGEYLVSETPFASIQTHIESDEED